MADETKDASKRELIAVAVRFVKEGKVEERVVGFVETSELDAVGLSAKIIDVLQPLNLDPLKCAGFGFDGASVMAGIHGGVAVHLKQIFKNALYIHCHSHRLNLCLSGVAKSIKGVKLFFDILDHAHNF